MLPGLASRLDVDERHILGERFAAVAGRVPTRPHTMAPDKPGTGNVIVDRLTAPIDRIRDRLAGRDV